MWHRGWASLVRASFRGKLKCVTFCWNWVKARRRRCLWDSDRGRGEGGSRRWCSGTRPSGLVLYLLDLPLWRIQWMRWAHRKLLAPRGFYIQFLEVHRSAKQRTVEFVLFTRSTHVVSGCALNMRRWALGHQGLVFGHVSFCLLILEHYLGPQMTSFGFSSGVSTKISGITVTSINLREHINVHVCEGVPGIRRLEAPPLCILQRRRFKPWGQSRQCRSVVIWGLVMLLNNAVVSLITLCRMGSRVKH